MVPASEFSGSAIRAAQIIGPPFVTRADPGALVAPRTAAAPGQE